MFGGRAQEVEQVEAELVEWAGMDGHIVAGRGWGGTYERPKDPTPRTGDDIVGWGKGRMYHEHKKAGG